MRRCFALLAFACGCDLRRDQLPPLDTVDAAACDAEDSVITRSMSAGIAPHVAADGHGNVLAAWSDGYGISYALSHDDGATFQAPHMLPSLAGRPATDPTVASDGADAFYVAWLSGTNGVFLNRISGTTGSAGPRVSVSGVPVASNRPWIAIDNSGTIVVAYTKPSSGLMVGYSIDGGANFLPSRLVAPRSASSLRSRFCIDRAGGPTAPLYLVFGSDEFALTYSIDGGASWSAPIVVATGAAAQDADCAVRGPDVWVSLGATFFPPASDFADELGILHSPDGGLTFERGIRVAKNNLFFNPALAMTAAGTLELLYYEGPIADHAVLTLAHSSDGHSFTCGRIADVGPLTNDPHHFGDYLGLAAAGGHLYAAFGDDSLAPGYSHVSFARIDAP